MTTARLALRPYAPGDEESWHQITSDPTIVRYLSWPARTRAESRMHLRDRMHHTHLGQADDILALAVERDGQYVGDVSLQLRAIAPEVRMVEAGWLLHPEHRGRGYATEACTALMCFAFDSVHARVVTAVIHRDNEPSLSLAHRLGFLTIDASDSDVLLVLPVSHFRRRLEGRAENHRSVLHRAGT
jgi:RimJ/RimL family protein N-acetyltransferase